MEGSSFGADSQIYGSDPRVRRAPRTWSHRPTISVRVFTRPGPEAVVDHVDKRPSHWLRPSWVRQVEIAYGSVRRMSFWHSRDTLPYSVRRNLRAHANPRACA